jgi:glycosyltransferase involved in cell wall biosynthesis
VVQLFDRKRRFLAAVGDANNPVTWSGIPFHFLQAAKAGGLLDEGLPLTAGGAGWRARRWRWNAFNVLAGDRYGGYQYSVSFLEALWAPYRARLRDTLVMNCFQLYPPWVVADRSVEKWFFIDQTLLQLFDHYELRTTIGRRIGREAVQRERDGYQAAAGVITHSRWAARSVIEEYGVSPEKVHVVVPGANLDHAIYSRWEKEELGRRKSDGALLAPLKLVFVGKDWRRKGLDRLLRGLAIAQLQGCQATLRIIGCARESLPISLRHLRGLECYGFIDKRRHAERFLRLVANCDVGCLLSRAEAGGIVLREYHALGLAVLGTTAGGAPDHACPEASWFVDPDASDELVAEKIFAIDRDQEKRESAKNEAWTNRCYFLYPAAVRKISEVMAADTARSKTA